MYLGVVKVLLKLSMHATCVIKELSGIEPRTLEILHYEVSTLPTELFDTLKNCATYVSKELAGIEPKTLERWHY